MKAEQVIGVVLAGGRSTRMGCEKALLRLGGPAGPTLLADRLGLLLELELADVLVSLRADLAARDPLRGGGPVGYANTAVVLDRSHDGGPLAGIAAALRRARGRTLLVLAVDMPDVDAPLLARLLERCTPTRGCAPRVDGRWEPLCAIYPPGALPLAERALLAGRASASALLDELERADRLRPLDLSGAAARRLVSWNRPDDVRPVLRLRSGASARGA